jgi:hypothetical protein
MVAPGESITYKCCVGALCSPPATVTYLPEPGGMLLAGVLLLAALKRPR